MGVSSEYRYYRWAGFLLRHPEGDADAAEILKMRDWNPAPKEAVIDVTALPEVHPPGGRCTRLSSSEASRMAAAFGMEI